MNPSKTFVTINQYGHSIKMWGSGIYNHDSYFKAPIFIGSDMTILLLVIPLTLVALYKEVKYRTLKSKLVLTSMNSIILYYGASLAFGVTFNSLFILYTLLFGLSFFTMIYLISEIDREELGNRSKQLELSLGLKIYLFLSGLSLFVAWLPDIIPTYFTGHSLSLIEVYTTEITYILDMAIVSPIIFICLYQLKKQIVFGNILLPIILRTCEIIGIMIKCKKVTGTVQ